MPSEIWQLSAAELARRIRHREVAVVDVVDAFLDRIDARNDVLDAFITVAAESARQRAQEADRALENGRVFGPLHGIPVGIKDLQPVEGMRHTMGLGPLRDNIATRDSVVVQRLKDAGAIIVGKTNLPELAHKGVSVNPICGPTVTPFDTERTAGGSSGGSAAAVADGLCPIAQGSDGSGSIRVPAAFCGVFGLKPTFGVVPYDRRPDGFAHGHPYNHIGPLTRTVEDAALMLDVMAGHHPRDPYSAPMEDMDYVGAVNDRSAEFEVAFAPELGVFTLDDEVRRVVDAAVDRLTAAGNAVDHIDPDLGYSFAELRDAHWTQNKVWNAEEAVILEAEYGVDVFGSDRSAISEPIVTRMEEGREISALDYRLTDVTRSDLLDTIDGILAEYDALITATTAVPPFGRDYESPPAETYGDAVASRGGWMLTFPFNQTGHPVASVPAGFTDDGLPVGMQVVGARHDDGTVLSLSAAVERSHPWADAYPMNG